MTRICDKDCLHCRFADCILEELDAEDYREARARDKELTYTPEQRQIAAKQRAYYEANKEEIAAKQRAYREANKEKIAAYQRAYREANKEKIAAYQRAYYEANKEKRPTRRPPQSSAKGNKLPLL